MSMNKSKLLEAAPVSGSATSKTIDATVTEIKDNAAKATAGVAASQTRMKEGVEKVMKTAEQVAAFNQGNVEAMVKSGQIWASGMQDISKHFASAAQASMADGIAAFKALTGVKSLKDALELQASFARSTMEKSVAESNKLTDASMKLTERALAPITARVTVAVETFGKTA